MVFRTSPEWRQKYEQEIVELYYETLLESGAKYGTNLSRESYPIAQCWKDYADFGALKMVYYFTILECFVDRHCALDIERSFKSFIVQHNVTPENVPPFML